MNRMPEDPKITLVGALVEQAARDLLTWLDADNPNRRAAGRAALHSLDAAISALQTTRRTLIADLGHNRPGTP